MNILTVPKEIVVSLSSDKYTYCKSLWIKASAERPECNVNVPVFSGLLPVCWAASVPVSCGSIYKSFAGCLVTLGDSMGDSMGDTQKDSSTQDIDAICRFVFALPRVSGKVKNKLILII